MIRSWVRLLTSAFTQGLCSDWAANTITPASACPRPSFILAMMSSPGAMSHLSSQVSIPSWRRWRARASSAGLSLEEWLRKTFIAALEAHPELGLVEVSPATQPWKP